MFLLVVTVPPVPTQVVWYCNGKQIKEGPRYKFYVDNGTYTLEIQETTGDDLGEFTAEVTNQTGTSITKCRVAVDGKQENTH